MEKEENKSKSKELVDLMRKIDIEMERSRDRQTKIDGMTAELYEETRPMMVEKRKEEIEKAKQEKAQFDEMNKNALVNAKKLVLELRKELEMEHQKSLLENMKQKDGIKERLAKLKTSDMPAEKLLKAEEVAKNAIEKNEKKLEDIQKDFDKKNKNLDLQEKSIWDYAVELGVEKEIDEVKIDDPKKEEKAESEKEEKAESEKEEKAESEKEEKAEPKKEEKAEPKKEEKAEPKKEEKAEPKKEEKAEPKKEEKAEPKKEEKAEPKKEEKAELKKEEKAEPKKEVNTKSEKDPILERYSNDGFGKNVAGWYFNPWIDEYDPGYDPHNDKSYNTELETKTEKAEKTEEAAKVDNNRKQVDISKSDYLKQKIAEWIKEYNMWEKVNDSYSDQARRELMNLINNAKNELHELENGVKARENNNQKVDNSKAKSEDDSKAKSEDDSKGKSDDNSKAKSDDDSKEKSDDNSKAKSEDDSKAKSDDDSKGKSDDTKVTISKINVDLSTGKLYIEGENIPEELLETNLDYSKKNTIKGNPEVANIISKFDFDEEELGKLCKKTDPNIIEALDKLEDKTFLQKYIEAFYYTHPMDVEGFECEYNLKGMGKNFKFAECMRAKKIANSLEAIDENSITEKENVFKTIGDRIKTSISRSKQKRLEKGQEEKDSKKAEKKNKKKDKNNKRTISKVKDFGKNALHFTSEKLKVVRNKVSEKTKSARDFFVELMREDVEVDEELAINKVNKNSQDLENALNEEEKPIEEESREEI